MTQAPPCYIMSPHGTGPIDCGPHVPVIGYDPQIPSRFSAGVWARQITLPSLPTDR